MSEWDLFKQANKAADKASMKMMTDTFHEIYMSCIKSGFNENEAMYIVGTMINASVTAAGNGGRNG